MLNRRRWGVDPKPTRRDVALTNNLTHRIAYVAKRWCESCEQTVARLGGCNAPGGPIEEPNPESLLQLAKVLAQRRRGDL